MDSAEFKRFIFSIEIKALEKALVHGEGESPFVSLIRERIEMLKREARWFHPLEDRVVKVPSIQSSELLIRNAVADDIDRLQDIRRRSSLSNKGDIDLIAAHPEWLVWDDALLPYATVAVHDGKALGFATALPIEDYLELEDLFTDPDWMRQGVASALIADLARRGLRIEVSANRHAKAFYESAGFVVVGTYQSVGEPQLRMHLEVSP
ncbi:GNAT family N-acetyltransferase [Paenibacillus glycanilyticus]|uniref:N-acetyltransferase domain-containing protein n=1 Tax=Paenibacillus glycanilyticus TaxID=126569 RepID=A0ABQ6GA10_9BACL|nr:GNAT family N-acetyltransferase [Paenibacillus glycanilyticus]GLX67335.1 hypothetical protein MU1_16800 [Paenibacillus glycanilyticus]